MKRTFKIGQTIYHGWRYWKSDNLEKGEVLGWNTLYLPYRITKITAARIHVEHKDTRVQLNREAMERDGKQYHSRFHEYFYAEKPAPESKEWNWAGSSSYTLPSFGQVFGVEVSGDSRIVSARDPHRSATCIQTSRAKTASRSRREPSGLY